LAKPGGKVGEMNRVDSFIASCPSWEVFYKRLKELSKGDMGRIFERFVQLYLETQPYYRNILSDVWLGRHVPADVRKAINLPYRDEGIDLIARTKRGKYWAIQAKFRSDENETLSRRLLATFTACASDTCRNISQQIVAHASLKPIGKRELYRNTQEMSFDRWARADWSLIVRKLKGKTFNPEPRTPMPHQVLAVKRAKEHFIRDKATRGRMLMPCATGKSLAALWIADALNAKTIVVAVPNLGLIRQGVEDWSKEFVSRGQTPDWICVCSDDQLENDEFVDKIGDLAMDVDTDPKEIAKLLKRRSKLKIVFTTYQSSEQLAEAARRAGIKFDLAIFDEAHRTVGPQDRSFAALLGNSFKARYRLFMTATERRVNGDFDNVYSMDDNEEVYGKRFYTMSFAEAIRRKIITDYKILTLAITDKEIKALIAKNRLLNLNSNLTEAEARSVATGIALKRATRNTRSLIQSRFIPAFLRLTPFGNSKTCSIV
jgi:predicted helicase